METDIERPKHRYMHIVFPETPYNQLWPVAIPVHALKEIQKLSFCTTRTQLAYEVKKTALHCGAS
jgi:hypothetical protein